jgi:hypothetical protein
VIFETLKVSIRYHRQNRGLPEKQDAGCAADLVICDDVPEFLGDIANGFEDGVTSLRRINDDSVSAAGWDYDWRSGCGLRRHGEMTVTQIGRVVAFERSFVPVDVGRFGDSAAW